jgi:hypothetical protein
MTRILTIIALLFATPAFAFKGQSNNADGKSFFCEPIGGLGRTIGLTFRNGKPAILWQDGTESEEKFYMEMEQDYWWTLGDIAYQMRRQNLQMTMWMDDANQRADWQCAMEELDVIKTKLKALHEEYLRNRPKNKF